MGVESQEIIPKVLRLGVKTGLKNNNSKAIVFTWSPGFQLALDKCEVFWVGWDVVLILTPFLSQECPDFTIQEAEPLRKTMNTEKGMISPEALRPSESWPPRDLISTTPGFPACKLKELSCVLLRFPLNLPSHQQLNCVLVIRDIYKVSCPPSSCTFQSWTSLKEPACDLIWPLRYEWKWTARLHSRSL